MAIGVDNRESTSLRALTSAAAEDKRRFLETSKNMCSAQSGVVSRICELRRKGRSLKIQASRLSYSKGRCKYTNNEEECIKALESKVAKLNSEMKNIDAMIRKQQQKLK
jgi:hypothetical protein